MVDAETTVSEMRMTVSAALPRLLADLVSRGDLVVPPYPAAALKLRRIVETENFALSEVAEAAAADPALAAALLRVANSPLYQSAGTVITSLGRAVHRLGARSVAAIATAASVGSGAVAAGPLIDVKFRVWRRSVTCALACQRLADRKSVDPDEAFLAGLLHGFGRCVAVACLERLLPSLPQQTMSLLDWMQAAEPHRAELARTVARQWQMPDALTRVIAGEGGPENAMSAVVALAERVAAAVERGASAEQIAVEAGIAPSERRALEAFLHGLPAAIEALVQPPDASKRPKASSAVTKPATALSGDLRPTSLAVFDLRVRRDPVRLAAVAVGMDGLVLETSKPMQESCVARLSLGEGAGSIEGWFSVVLCVPERTGFRVEVQPFAASRELRQFLVEQSAKAANSSGAASPSPPNSRAR